MGPDRSKVIDWGKRTDTFDGPDKRIKKIGHRDDDSWDRHPPTSRGCRVRPKSRRTLRTILPGRSGPIPQPAISNAETGPMHSFSSKPVATTSAV